MSESLRAGDVLVVDGFECGGYRVVFREPLRLTVAAGEDGYMAVGELSAGWVGPDGTLAELRRDVVADLAMLWENYGADEVAAERLTPAAQTLRQQLRGLAVQTRRGGDAAAYRWWHFRYRRAPGAPLETTAVLSRTRSEARARVKALLGLASLDALAGGVEIERGGAA